MSKKMQKLYITGFVLVEYIGEKPTPLMGRELNDKEMLNKGDMFIAQPHTAFALCGGTNYKIVRGVREVGAFLAEQNEQDVSTEDVKTEDVNTEEVKTEEVKTEEVKTEEVKTEEVKTEEVKKDGDDDFILTRENIMQADIKHVKALLKSRGITIGKKKPKELIALAIPLL